MVGQHRGCWHNFDTKFDENLMFAGKICEKIIFLTYSFKNDFYEDRM